MIRDPGHGEALYADTRELIGRCKELEYQLFDQQHELQKRKEIQKSCRTQLYIDGLVTGKNEAEREACIAESLQGDALYQDAVQEQVDFEREVMLTQAGLEEMRQVIRLNIAMLGALSNP